VNWVLTQEPLDVETELALGFLDYLMLGTSAAPLRKALNDSKLGAALVGGGMDDELKQPVWSVGLKVGDTCTVAGRQAGLANHVIVTCHVHALSHPT
jgi:Zn-dependent M16 (insulinase) family peptidase